MIKRLFVILMALSLWGCAFVGKAPSPLISEEVLSLIEAIGHANDGMSAFKGIGKFHLWNRNQTASARVAWVGADEERFRVEILGVSGHPVSTMAGDGKWIYLLSKTEKRLYKHRSADGDLRRMLFIALKPRDLVSLLAGRVPIPEYSFAELLRHPVQGPVLVLKRGRHVVEKVYLSDDLVRVLSIERFDRSGELLFRAVFESMQTIEGYRVPEQLAIIGPEARMVLTVERYWASANVSSEIFELDNPR